MPKIQKWGVGFGHALLSRKIGNLKSAAVELVRLIKLDYDSRRLNVLRVRRCPECNSDSNPNCWKCFGFKYLVADPPLTWAPAQAKPQNTDVRPTVRIFFMSGPKTTAADRRTWLYRVDGEPSIMVRVYVSDGGRGRTFVCDCDAGPIKTCEHVDAVAKADAGKFGILETDTIN